jgi:myo-inositol 2-dehydrogenase / D-chiro-inositol 1-dehydrogenase
MEWKIGVIGTGAIGKDHIRRLTQVINGAKVVALSDIDSHNARKLAGEYNAIFYETGEEVIQDPNVDAVLIASWDPTHADYVLQCIRAQKFVFCEKPLAISAEECLEIVKAEIAYGKRLVQVGFMRRYDKGYRALKEIIDSGKIGAPLMLHCCHRNRIPGPKHTTDMTIKNSGIHEIDVLRWLLGENYESGQVLIAKQNRNAEDGLEDPQIILLKTESGVRIDVEINMNSHYGYDIQCEVVGEKGTARLPDPNTLILRTGGTRSYEIYSDWSQRFVEAYDVELQQWINSLGNGAPTGPSAWDGYVACVTADTLVRARVNSTIELISITEQPEFYRTDL